MDTVTQLQASVARLYKAFDLYKKEKGFDWADLVKKYSSTNLAGELKNRGESTLRKWLTGAGAPGITTVNGFNITYISNLKKFKNLNRLIIEILKLFDDFAKVDMSSGIPLVQYNEDQFDYEPGTKGIYRLIYWSIRTKKTNYGLLNLRDKEKAALEIQYNNPHKLAGSYFIEQGTYYVRLKYQEPQFDEQVRFPEMEIVFYKDGGSNCYMGSYLSALCTDGTPDSGVILVMAESTYRSLAEHNTTAAGNGMASAQALLESAAHYLLFYKRYSLKQKNFTFPVQDEDDHILMPEIRLWLNIQPFTGCYEGWFIHPESKTFENCIILISPNGKVRMWVEADKSPKKYYSGFARKTGDRLLLDLDYDPNDLLDYRTRIHLNTKKYVPEGAENEKDVFENTLFGTFSGYIRGSDIPFAIRFAMKKISASEDFDDSILKRIRELSFKTEISEIVSLMHKLNVFDFFSGILPATENFCATDKTLLLLQQAGKVTINGG